MTQELIYTSTAMGLKPGSRGFCTVAMTPGMPPRTVTLLESLSGYRHVVAPSGPPHPDNPVAWNHFITSTGEHLLSRVADAGLDYSGRTNKLAHHIVLGANERTAAGPAAAMLEPTNFIDRWSVNARMIGARSIASGTSHAGVCNAWKQLTGDAGWAAVLASSALGQDVTDAYLIYGPNQNLLPLIAESLALLNPEQRWQVTYSTYFTGLPPGLRCQWKCVLHGSKEHAAVPPHNRVVRIDFTRQLPTAPMTSLSPRARNGVASSATAPKISTNRQPARVSTTEDGLLALERDLAMNMPTGAHSPKANPEAPLSELHEPRPLQLGPPSPPKRKRKLLGPMVAIMTVAFVASLVGLTYVLIQPYQTVTSSAPPTTATSPVVEFLNERKPSLDPTTPSDLTDPTESPSGSTDTITSLEQPKPIAPEPTKALNSIDAMEPTDVNQIPDAPETPSGPLSATLVYLLSSEGWKGVYTDRFRQQGSHRDTKPLTIRIGIESANELTVLAKQGEFWRRDNQFLYNQETGFLNQLQQFDDPLASDARIAAINDDRITLERLYIQKLGGRLILVQGTDEHFLLTLDGAIHDPGDSPSPQTVTLTTEGTTFHSLDAICPLLSNGLRVSLTDVLPTENEIRSFNDNEVQLVVRQPNSPSTVEAKLNVKLKEPTEERSNGPQVFKVELTLSTKTQNAVDAQRTKGERRDLANQIRTAVRIESDVVTEDKSFRIVLAELHIEVQL